MNEALKPRNITTQLTDQECIDLANLAAKCGYTVGEIISSYVHDLLGSNYSNGSDERFLANEYFDRCCILQFAPNTFLKWLVEYDYIESYLTHVDKIEHYTRRLRYLKAHLSESEENQRIYEAENAFLSELKESFDEYYLDYTEETERPEPKEEAEAGVIKWRADLEKLKGNNKKVANRPRANKTIDPAEVEDMTKKHYSIEEAADLLGLHTNTIRRMIKRGDLPATKYGRQWRIKKEDLTEND